MSTKIDPTNCPNRGKLVAPWELLRYDQSADAHTLWCKLCGVGVRRLPYPEELREHPA